MDNCIFCKIATGEIPATVVYQDDQTVVFRDINPIAPVHLVVIPRRHVATLNDFGQDLATQGAMLHAAAQAARVTGMAETGYRVVFNVNRGAGQEVFHVHAHIIGGRNLGWPPG